MRPRTSSSSRISRRRRRAAHEVVQGAVAPPLPGAMVRRAAWRGIEVAGRLDVAFLVVLVTVLVLVAEAARAAVVVAVDIAVAVTTSGVTTPIAIAVVREIGVVRAKFPRDRTAAAQGPASLVPEPVTYLRAVVEVAAAAHERCELAVPDGVAALVAIFPQTVAADLRVRLVARAFFVHAPEARRHGIVVLVLVAVLVAVVVV